MTYSVSGATSKDSHPLREDVSWNNDWNIVWVFVTSHPLREDVSWNTEDRNIFSALEVILFVRMWVEILSPHLHILYAVRVILFVRMWVEITKTRSFSLVTRHPLREDVSWNGKEDYFLTLTYSHPLREDVSWNVKSGCSYTARVGHPLREDVSWNNGNLNSVRFESCHPLREDVSWNIIIWTSISC